MCSSIASLDVTRSAALSEQALSTNLVALFKPGGGWEPEAGAGDGVAGLPVLISGFGHEGCEGPKGPKGPKD